MKNMLTLWQDHVWPTIKTEHPLATGNAVIDAGAFDTIEIDKLFDAINHAETTIGQAVLYRSLTQPSDNIDALRAKQQALEELRDHPELKSAVENLVQNATADEKDFYLLLFGKFLGSLSSAQENHEIEGYGYVQYKKGVRFMLDLVERVRALETPSSAYLKALFDRIAAFADTRPYSLMQGPAFITENGIQCKQERRGSLMPALVFFPRLIKPVLIGLMIAVFWLFAQFAPAYLLNAIPGEAIFLTPFLLLYIPAVGGFDRNYCIIPLRTLYKNSPAVAETLDALGQLDELLSFLKYGEQFGHPMVLPTLVDGSHHRIQLSDAKNPVLAKNNADYVGNDLSLEDEKLMFITGPNSGGKTAFCKTVTQIQVLAQIGCWVPARAATLTVADRIFYQAPEISHLSDGEGRFGTELKRTKAIFLASTARSLIVLDELSEGTTFEEKMESSTTVLDGFYRKGNSTLLITHNHQLVDVFVNKRTGVARQVEFADEAPTFRLIPGISRVSHADRVAKKIGFSKADIDHYLEGTP